MKQAVDVERPPPYSERMRPFVARLVVLACAIVALAALVPIAEGYLWAGYGVLALAILGALKATARVPDDGFRYGVLFAVFAYLSVGANKPISSGLTARHLAAFAVAATVLRAFVGLSLRFNAGRRQLPG